ncbi:Ig-like domain-containing protein [Mastigocoleus testarum]
MEVDDVVDATEIGDVLVEGTAEPDSTIDVKFTDPNGNQVTTQVKTNPNGDWTLTGNEVDLTPLDDGPVSVEVISTDAAGNPSNPVSETINLDKNPPAQPAIKTPIEVDDIVDATEIGDVLVEGTAEPDSTIDVKFSDPNGNQVTTQVKTNPNGNWTLTENKVDLTPLDDGSVTVEAVAKDEAGNKSAPVSETVTKDITSNPPIAPDLEASDDSGVSDTDDITSNTTPTFTAPAETATPGDTVTLYADGKPVGTATIEADGSYSVVPDSPLSEGKFDIGVTFKDSADPNATESPLSPVLPVTIDSSTPEPIITTPRKTGDITPEITGSAEPGTTVTVGVDINSDGTPEAIYEIITDVGDNWNIDLETAIPNIGSTPTFNDGDRPTITAFATDEAGNTSPEASKPLEIDIDIPALTPPTITSAATTSDTTPEISGTAQPNIKLSLEIDASDDGTPEATYETTADPQGNWRIDLETATPKNGAAPTFNNGDRANIKIIAIDNAGNSSDAATQQLIIDQAVTDAPVINSPTITNDTTPEITGTAQPGINLTIEIDSDGDDTPEATYQTTANDQGRWRINLETADPITGSTPKLSDGDQVGITAIAISPDGNNSLEVNQKLTIDTTAPTITINPLTTRDKTPEIAGTVNDPQAKISITIDGINYDGINNGNGSWVLTDNTIASPLPNGSYSIIASATDPAGNFSQSENRLVIAAPLPKDDNIRIPRGPSGDIRIDVLANDLDLQGEILSIIDVKQPKNGRVSIDDNGTPNDSSDDRLVYIPSANTTNNVVIKQSNISRGVFSLGGDSFQDSFSYTVRDSSGNEQTATVNVKDQVKLKFNLDINNADWRNEIGIFKVDDAAGTINGIAPGQPGYIEAALSSGKVIFSALSQKSQLFGQNPTRIIDSFSSNDNLGFFLVQNSTVDAVLAGGNATVIFGSATANGDQFQNLNAAQIASGQFTLNWEDTTGGGDQDFNDLGLTVETTTEDGPLGSALQGGQNRELIDVTETNSAVTSTQKVIATMEVFGDSAFDNVTGLYRIADESGKIIDSLTGQTFNPGDQGYAEAAMRQSMGQFSEDDNGATITLDGDALYAPYLLANGNTDDIYFTFLDANSDGADHIRLLGDNTFGFEDLRGGGDRSFDDLVVKMNLTIG